LVRKGDQIAGTRIIPLYISNQDFLKALNTVSASPLFGVAMLRKAKVGILSTGTEVFEGLIEDKYTQIIKNKVSMYQCEVVSEFIVPDEIDEICAAIDKMILAGADLIITTAGLSVDPDDVTYEAIVKSGATDVLYSAPILPGSMILLAKIGKTQIIGVPACGIFNTFFSFDIVLPRFLANIDISEADIAKMGNGGLLYQKNKI
jgi:formylmethanofuran dehydrogenase subunit E